MAKLKCKKHPSYKGVQKPRVVCDQCVDVYLQAYRKRHGDVRR